MSESRPTIAGRDAIQASVNEGQSIAEIHLADPQSLTPQERQRLVQWLRAKAEEMATADFTKFSRHPRFRLFPLGGKISG